MLLDLFIFFLRKNLLFLFYKLEFIKCWQITLNVLSGYFKSLSQSIGIAFSFQLCTKKILYNLSSSQDLLISMVKDLTKMLLFHNFTLNRGVCVP